MNAPFRLEPSPTTDGDPKVALRRQVDGRMAGLRVNRYSWWVHWRELADYMLPRRYKWLITPNQMGRGSPINQHIIDSTATLAARNLASGMISGVSSPTSAWFRLKLGRMDSTMTGPIAQWLKAVETIMMMVFQESGFYTAVAVLYFDLIIFGTGAMLEYEDFDNVVKWVNPCLGEYFVDVDGNLKPCLFYREFTLTVPQIVDEFGFENCSPPTKALFSTGAAQLTREAIIGHAIEPNDDGRKYGIPSHFKYREVYWEIGQSAEYILRKRGFHELPAIIARWDLVSNDAYGRSPAMDALPDTKQLQLEVKRKAQAIDKLVNPPLVADIQLKNQPASLLPGGITYVAGMGNKSHPGFAPVYTIQPPVKEISEDLAEIRERIKETFFNNLFQTISQYVTRSNVTAAEIDARRSESMVMLGPVLERLQTELLAPIIERTYAIMSRAGILPPAPAEIAGQNISVQYISMLSQAQQAAQTAGIERVLQLGGNLAGIDPAAMDNIDVDFALDKMSTLLNNDPRLIRTPQELAQIRQQRAQQQAQAQNQQNAMAAAEGAKTLSETDVGGGQNALQRMLGGA